MIGSPKRKAQTHHVLIDVLADPIAVIGDGLRAHEGDRVVFHGNAAFELRFDKGPELGSTTRKFGSGTNHVVGIKVKSAKGATANYKYAVASGSKVLDPILIVDPA